MCSRSTLWLRHSPLPPCPSGIATRELSWPRASGSSPVWTGTNWPSSLLPLARRPTSLAGHNRWARNDTGPKNFHDGSRSLSQLPNRTVFETRDLVGYLRHLGIQQRAQDLSLIANIESLLDQADAQDGVALDDLLQYEPNPTVCRRAITNASVASRPQTLPSGHEMALMSAGPLDATVGTEKASQMACITERGHETTEESPDGDGVVCLSYIIAHSANSIGRIGRLDQHVTTCSGFVIETQDSREPLVVTCAHTLWQSGSAFKAHFSSDSPSGCLVKSSSGKVYAVTKVAAALAAADLLLLNVKELDRSGCLAPARMRSLPVSPYPPEEQSAIWVPQLAPKSAGSMVSWEAGQVIEYRDVMGIGAKVSLLVPAKHNPLVRNINSKQRIRVANKDGLASIGRLKPGTYDQLMSFTFTTIPVDGSSGGPIVDPNGAVVGLVRGHQSGYGERQSRGFATVAEKIWELFRLPGFRPKSASKARTF